MSCSLLSLTLLLATLSLLFIQQFSICTLFAICLKVHPFFFVFYESIPVWLSHSSFLTCDLSSLWAQRHLCGPFTCESTLHANPTPTCVLHLQWKQIFYTENTEKKTYMIQTNDIVVPLIEQPRVCKCMHALVDVQERVSRNKIWTKKKKTHTSSDHQSRIHTNKAFSVYTHYSTSLKSTTERGEHRETGSEIERAKLPLLHHKESSSPATWLLPFLQTIFPSEQNKGWRLDIYEYTQRCAAMPYPHHSTASAVPG